MVGKARCLAFSCPMFSTMGEYFAAKVSGLSRGNVHVRSGKGIVFGVLIFIVVVKRACSMYNSIWFNLRYYSTYRNTLLRPASTQPPEDVCHDAANSVDFFLR
ncbi:hypothetical protein BKA58DRAFT_133179 [Alternaria rosae]|uniref:uncharacterized protein n=1 Tax=Alternaria rosae TaxID=1187941 RepID=UPI001E8D1B67|nr:uncharacterized protein BKA58DRAFT_133179 [Alternaria rosae]KAH6876022.1 hypothetical protein BKA58DRAFT_133179 [Alternaria rosae]